MASSQCAEAHQARACACAAADSDQDPQQPGGGRAQQYDERNVARAPPGVRAHQLAGVSAEYRTRVLADGIPFRPHGLFPPADPLLRRLAAEPRLHPFEKHLPGETAPYELLPKGGWATGDAAARRGMDLRLFYQVAAQGRRADSCALLMSAGLPPSRHPAVAPALPRRHAPSPSHSHAHRSLQRARRMARFAARCALETARRLGTATT